MIFSNPFENVPRHTTEERIEGGEGETKKHLKR